jgi:ankyrin repeat protein
MLRRLKSIRDPSRDGDFRSVGISCGDLADFVRLVWEGLNFEFRETPKGKVVVIYRSVELSEAALESYRESVGRMFAWAMFSSFTEERDKAEGYGVAWRKGVPVIFELRSAWCPRLWDGTYLLHPFAVLQVEAVVGNVVKIVDVELLEPARVTELPGQREDVVPMEGEWTKLHVAAKCGDIRAIAKLATRPEVVNARAKSGSTPLAIAVHTGKTEAVKALASLGADVNMSVSARVTPILMAVLSGHLEMVKVLASLGANVNAAMSDGTTPVDRAAEDGYLEVVVALASVGANLNVPVCNGATPIHIAARRGHVEVVKALASLGANVNFPMHNGATPVFIAAERGHVEVVKALASFGTNVTAPMNDGCTPALIAARNGHFETVRALAALGAQ